MARSKSKKGQTNDSVQRNSVMVRGLRWVAVWGFVGVVGFIATRVLWDGHRDELLADPRFHLVPEEIDVGSLPAWIHHDPRPEFLLNATQDGALSVADRDCLAKLVDGIQKHPWVSRVGRAEKRFPGVAVVQVEWRRPVAMVRVPGGLLPVDETGVLLPTRDFTPLEASRYPRIEGAESVPRGPAGTVWADPLIKQGASLAAHLLPVWVKYQFRSIMPLQEGSGTRGLEFQIVTREGSIIQWGEAGNGPQEDEKTARKLRWLEEYYREHGSFAGLDGPLVIDLRPAEPQIRAKEPVR
jgi:hypothetical protein